VTGPEVEIDAEFDGMDLLVDTGIERPARSICQGEVSSAKIIVQIFGLGGPALRKGPFDAGARDPAGAILAAAEVDGAGVLKRKGKMTS
jgi:hypothetical protein